MQANHSLNKAGLTWRRDVLADTEAALSRIALLETVFGTIPADSQHQPRWIASGYFDGKGDCIANVDVADLDLMLDGAVARARGIRLVAVRPDWRGQGLLRDLMSMALASGDTDTPSLVLLYAETADLYRRYGFRSVPQFAFAGDAPQPCGIQDARVLDRTSDRRLIERMLARRAPVSLRCALVGAPGLVLDRLAADVDIHLTYLCKADAIVAYEIDGETLVLVDVVADTIPSLTTILGAIPRRITTVKTLFPPDRLDWLGTPVPDDTGLMIRGPLPPAMAVPFMLPPTTEF